jgi:methylmalonyl-CoA mutase
VARNTHHLLKEESQLNKVIDPLGGSYYLETLTDRIGESAWDLVREIEEQGGFFQALEKGSIQARIEASRQKRRESVENEERIIVGVNAYRDEEASILEQREEERKKPPKGKEITPLPQERISIEME